MELELNDYLTYIHEMYLQVDECTGSLLVRSLSSVAESTYPTLATHQMYTGIY